MFTNTYAPHVGGVVRSILTLRDGLLQGGHSVMVVAPRFDGCEDDEADVLRLPSLRRFRGSTFSVPLPLGRRIGGAIDAFAPDIIHSHHPFLLGDTALRIAASRNLPTVYTYHTRYERYGHYLGLGEELTRRLAQSLSVGYCNLCDAIIAPSQGIADELAREGVARPVRAIPTGVAPDAFARRDAQAARQRFGLPEGAVVVGHLGRLVVEKNLGFLAEAISVYLARHESAWALIAGPGPVQADMKACFAALGVENRVIFAGSLSGEALADFYAAIDIFAFSSTSETQGLVLVEAMAAGNPVVALDSVGVRDVVCDGENGRLLAADVTAETFAAAIGQIAAFTPSRRARMDKAARSTASGVTADEMVRKTLMLYAEAVRVRKAENAKMFTLEYSGLRGMTQQMRILGNLASAVGHAMVPTTGH